MAQKKTAATPRVNAAANKVDAMSRAGVSTTHVIAWDSASKNTQDILPLSHLTHAVAWMVLFFLGGLVVKKLFFFVQVGLIFSNAFCMEKMVARCHQDANVSPY